jgi:hypothetical protein
MVWNACYSALDMSSSSRVQGRDWSATARAGEDCKTYSPASCEIALSSDCFIGVGVTVVFPYPHRADMPGALSVDIVSDSGQKLYSTERPNHCRTEGNICEATIAIP